MPRCLATPDSQGGKLQEYTQARAAAIAHLKQYATVGVQEASYAIDRDTGEVLDFVEGDLLSVEHDADKVLVRTRLCVLHSHAPQSPPGAEDWDEFIRQDQMRELVVVDARRIYTLLKPDDWTVQEAIGVDSRIAGGQFDIQSRRIERGYRPLGDVQISVAQMVQEIISQTNRHMARIYKVMYTEEIS